MGYRGDPTVGPLEVQVADLQEWRRTLSLSADGGGTTPGVVCDCEDGAPGPAGANGAAGATGPAGPAATVTVLNEGVLLGPFASMDFVGAGVTASIVGTAATVTIPGGGGGAGSEPTVTDWMF